MEGIFYNLSDESLTMIRFYADGEIIEMNFGKAENYDKELFDTLDRNHIIAKLHPDIHLKGIYNVDKDKIFFKLSSKSVDIECNCQIINSEEIIINSHSLTTQYKSVKRYNSVKHFPKKNDFVKITDSYYPIILIPNKIKNSLINNPTKNQIYNHLNISVPNLVLIKEPVKPEPYNYISLETSKFEGNGCMSIAYLIIILFFAYIAIYSLTTERPLLSLMFLVFVIFLFPQLGKFKNETKIKKVDLAYEEYKKKLTEYESELAEIRKQNEAIKIQFKTKTIDFEDSISSKIEIVSKEIHFESLKPFTGAKRNLENIKRGKYELIFLNLLYKEFGEQIKVDFAPNLDFETYYPDFTFVCNKTNLHIDIEIDEPYSLIDKTPIHHTESNDDERNKFFLEQNWCVIRFSEKQIATQPNECIELVKSFIKSIIHKSEDFNNNVIKDSRWTYEKSLIMSHNNYRTTY